MLAVGPGKLNAKDGTRVTPPQLKAGDVVLFTAWAGDEFKDAKQKAGEVLVMHESDVLAVVGWLTSRDRVYGIEKSRPVYELARRHQLPTVSSAKLIEAMKTPS